MHKHDNFQYKSVGAMPCACPSCNKVKIVRIQKIITLLSKNNGSKGSAEDELGDGGAKYSKIRPMREEMYLCVPVGATARVAPTGTHKCIATDSGETTKLEMILAVLSSIKKNPDFKK